ncbi:MAG TPA: hypothetical protein PLZ45_12475 [Ferruginibacter sp.]|nr:hypothetical protein [Ferruginibacter sp.]
MSITSPAFVPKGATTNTEAKQLIEGVSGKTPASAPANTATVPAPAQKPADSNSAK